MREDRAGQAQLIGDVIDTVLKEVKQPGRGKLHALSEAWCQAAGPEVARRTRVVGLAGGTLTVHVESSVLRHEIDAYRKGEILGRLKEAYPFARIVTLRCLLRAAVESV